jgi:hypothetical protein
MSPGTITGATAHTPPSDHTPTPPTNTTPPTPPTLNTQPSPPTPHTTGYTHPPLPPLLPTDIRILSHNINTLHTASQAELGATFDKYQELDPTILCLQECNKNWSQYDKTEGPLRATVTRHWPGAKVTTAHCREPNVFHGPHQPGGVAQMILRKLTGRVSSCGHDELGCYTWLAGNPS